MFSEIVQLVDYAVKAFADTRAAIEARKGRRRGWRDLYELYLSIDEITNAAISGLGHFRALNEYSQDEINEQLEILTNAVKRFLASFQETYRAIGVYNEDLRDRLAICLWMKSRWYSEFMRIYSAGILNRRSKRLVKNCLRMSFDIEKWRKRTRHHYDIGRDPEFLKEVTFREEVDLSLDEKLASLIKLGQKNIDELRQLKQQLRVYLNENCSLKDLLGA